MRRRHYRGPYRRADDPVEQTPAVGKTVLEKLVYPILILLVAQFFGGIYAVVEMHTDLAVLRAGQTEQAKKLDSIKMPDNTPLWTAIREERDLLTDARERVRVLEDRTRPR